MNGLLQGMVLALQAVTPDQNLPDEIEFTNVRVGRFQVVATSFVETWTLEPGRRYPVVRNVRCEVRGDGLTVTMDRSGLFRVRIARIWDDGSRWFGELSIRALQIGRTRYETRPQSTTGPHHFLDVRYPVDDGRIVTSQFSGYLAVRRAGEELWLNVDSLLPELLQASSVRVTYRYREDDDNDRWQLATYVVQLDGLAGAIERCQAELVSDRALYLNPPQQQRRR